MTPGNRATGVSLTGNITAKFSTGVTGVTGKSFILQTRAGKTVAAAVTYNRTTRVATLNPTRTLAADTTYVVTLNSSIKAGNALARTKWSFTTGPRPIMTRITPGVKATNVARSANATVRFNEQVSGVSGSSLVLVAANGRRVAAVVTYNRSTRVATLNPVVALRANTRYTVVVGNAIKDRAGNFFAGARWNFTTASR